VRAVVSTVNSHYRPNTPRRSGVQPRRGRCERRGCWLPVRTPSRLYAAPTGVRGAFALVRRLWATRCLPPTRRAVPVGAASSREEAGVSAGDFGCLCGRLRGCTPLLQGVRNAVAVVRRLRGTRCLPPTRRAVPVGAA